MKSLQTVYVAVSVKERLPEDTTAVFVKCIDKRDGAMIIDTTWYFGKNGFQIEDNGNSHLTVTHWLQPTEAILLSKREWDGVKEQLESDNWIDVKDRLPDITKIYERIEASDNVQIYDSLHGVNQAWLKRFIVDSIDSLSPEQVKGHWLFESSSMKYNNVTHWQPLPSPPINTI